MHKRSISTLVAGLALALVAALGLTAAVSSGSPAAPAAASAERPAAGTVAENKRGTMTSKIFGTAGKAKVRGQFVPLRFVQRGDRLAVRGVLHGVVKRASGPQTFTAIRTLRVKTIEGQRPGVAADASQRRRCDVLNLVLGPLDLDLLGLTVSLNRVVLDVVAVTGAGKLLGNLLCAVVGLLDGGPLARLVNVLNRILAVLRLGV